MATIDWKARAERVSQRLERLAGITDEPGRLTRTLLSPAMAEATQLVDRWMQEAGLQTSTDFIGNLVGRTPDRGRAPIDHAVGAERRTPNSKRRTLLIGSHLDTVRDAGRFDGALGVVLGIEIADISRSGFDLPFALMIAGFSDEEGVLFQTAYLGSRAFCGLLCPEDLDVSNQQGSLRQLLIGAQPRRAVVPQIGAKAEPEFRLPPGTVNRDQFIGYFEIHIEQGPILADRSLPIGVVTAIAGQSRFRFNWTGKAAHAGTTPVALRKDALLGAGRFALRTEDACRRFPGLVATVGELNISPNVSNVVPGRVIHSLDVRHQEDSVRAAAIAWLCQEADQIAAERQLGLERLLVQETPSVFCDPDFITRLAAATKSVTGDSFQLPSGAGHDAVILSQLCPAGMLFVRCRDGLSHHPDEFVHVDDMEIALRTAVRFIESFGSTPKGD
ncbi:MAG: Zn-dependent hydrolase [Verrucomicrobia bacterium]|nr:Zn-dependent hydrolase [Verrucomicrobiota bacterium]MBV8481857.1 Zn-dependent hydrolase [Verrucomicrobiota bacterium]